MSLTCPQLGDLAAELALGTISGAERAAALDHLAGCAPCRNLVDQLARAADSLLLLAPETEPPPGFESRVLSRMGVAASPVVSLASRRRRRALVVVAAAALVAGLSVGGAAVLDDDRAPSDVRTALASDIGGRWTCRAVVYGDDPTWLVVSLDRTDDLSATFSVEAVYAGRSTPVAVGALTIDRGHGTFAGPIELPADDIQSVRVLDAKGTVRYEMSF